MLFLCAMTIRFLRFELDTGTYRLTTRGGRPVTLRPKAFDLLVHLVVHRERVVPRDELIRSVWGHTNVGPGSLSGLVNELRTALGEPADEPGSIRTVHARGYQFVAPVEGEGGLDSVVGAARPSRAGLREALTETLRRHGVIEGQRVAPLVDRLCEIARTPARAPMRRVERGRVPTTRSVASGLGAGVDDGVSR